MLCSGFGFLLMFLTKEFNPVYRARPTQGLYFFWVFRAADIKNNYSGGFMRMDNLMAGTGAISLEIDSCMGIRGLDMKYFSGFHPVQCQFGFQNRQRTIQSLGIEALIVAVVRIVFDFCHVWIITRKKQNVILTILSIDFDGCVHDGHPVGDAAPVFVGGFGIIAYHHEFSGMNSRSYAP